MTKAQDRMAEEEAQAFSDERQRDDRRQANEAEQSARESQEAEAFFADQESAQDQAEAEAKAESSEPRKDQLTAYTADVEQRKADLTQTEASEARSVLVANRQEALRKADEFQAQHPTREELEASYAAADERQSKRDATKKEAK